MNARTHNGAAEEWRTLISDAEEMLRAFAGRGDEAADDVRRRLEATLNSARERLAGLEGDARQFASDARELTDEAATAADHYVRSNPWQAVAVAAAAGVILGALLARRSA